MDDRTISKNKPIESIADFVVSDDGKVSMDQPNGRLVIRDSGNVVRLLLGQPL